MLNHHGIIIIEEGWDDRWEMGDGSDFEEKEKEKGRRTTREIEEKRR